MAATRWTRPLAFLALVILIILAAGEAVAAVRVKVIVDSAGIKATPEIGSPTLANLPLGTILEVDAKQGEWYKVTTTKDGAALTGYIHELLVEEVAEGEAGGASSSGSPVVSQAETIAGIELRLAESKELDPAGKGPGQGGRWPPPAPGQDLRRRRPRPPETARLRDLSLAGLSSSKRGDSYGALREFLNMFEVDTASAKEATRNIYDPAVSSLIDQAEKQSRGLLVDYSLEITSDPKEATVRIDGREIGLTPEVYRTPVPKFSARDRQGRLSGYSEEVFLTRPSTKRNIVLESVGRTVLVSSVPAGARSLSTVGVLGKTTDCELPYVPYGSHALKLQKPVGPITSRAL